MIFMHTDRMTHSDGHVTLTMRDVVATSVRVAMARLDLDQTRLAVRMSALGTGWKRQTVGQVLKTERRVGVDELLALSLALECAMADLIAPSDPAHRSQLVDVSDDLRLPAVEVSAMAGFGMPTVLVGWDGDRPRFSVSRVMDTAAQEADRELAQRRRDNRQLAGTLVADEDALTASAVRLLSRIAQHDPNARKLLARDDAGDIIASGVHDTLGDER